MLKFLKVSCKEANEICNKSQYKEATFFEQVRLEYHISFCRVCALYSKQNRKLTDILKSKSIDCENRVHYMSEEDKELLKQKMKQFMPS